MDKYLSTVELCPLFTEIDPGDIQALLKCLTAKECLYAKNSFIFRADETADSVGIVLTGKVHIIQEDYWGKRTILTNHAKGDLFGEAFSCARISKLPVSVVAAEQSQILMIDYRKIVTTCSTACVFHSKLIRNMLKILAEKNILLTEKMKYITKRSTKDKLLTYLSDQALEANNKYFDIPFNRQELADYLSVDRSALSNELSKMKSEGILDFSRNHFQLRKDG